MFSFAANVTIIAATAPYGECASKALCCGFELKRDIRLFLFNRQNPTGNGIELPITDLEALRKILDAKSVDRKLKTAIFVHGFSEGAPDGESGTTIRDGN